MYLLDLAHELLVSFVAVRRRVATDTMLYVCDYMHEFPRTSSSGRV